MIPRFNPIIAACVRSSAPNLERMHLTRLFTVSSVVESLIRDLFVCIAGGDQPQHADFCRRQGVIGRMLGDFVRGLRGNAFFPACTARIVSRVPCAMRSSAGTPEHPP